MLDLYEVKSSDDGLTYFFTTQFELNYIVALTTNESLGVNAYSLNIYPESENQTCPIDYGIKNTVVDIIGRVLENEDAAIIYVCESTDGKENKRHMAFCRWYESGRTIFPYVRKYDHCFESEEGYKINSSLLYNINNPLAEDTIERFNELMGLF